ncbi:unnamed protein product [Ostreobium quekettii]|uniref:Mediator of RNA polymerase II transcription subunit 13 n=1 Tax=Ostreobium quekettii TaxID=121088 RepID=A0A8S1IUH0_9CHLO|nr:unnamed protein product [Ostreobium quekettii]|eukprot:evm.model.scf_927.2 EVM.evm.TU.scf_927.2   scf_927:31804-37592(+)
MGMDDRKPGLVAPEFSASHLRVERPCAEYVARGALEGGGQRGGSKRKPTRRLEPRVKKARTGVGERPSGCGDGAFGLEAGLPGACQEDIRARWQPYAPLACSWGDAAVLDLVIQQANAVVDLSLDRAIEFAEEQMGCPFVDASVGRAKGPESPLLRQCSNPQAKHSALAYVEMCSESESQGGKDAWRTGSKSRVGPAQRPLSVHLSEPSVLLGYQGDWLETSPSMARLWDKASFEPYSSPKPVVYYAICPDSMSGQLKVFLKDVSAVYEASNLGSHRPAPPSPASLSSEIISYEPIRSATAREANAAQALKCQQLQDRSGVGQHGGQDANAHNRTQDSRMINPRFAGFIPLGSKNDGLGQAGRKLRDAEYRHGKFDGSGIKLGHADGSCVREGPDGAGQHPGPLTADFRRGLKDSCARLQKLLILDPPDLRYTGGGLVDHFNASIVVYVMCPFDNPEACMQVLLEAASALAPCTRSNRPPVQPTLSEARTPGAMSIPDGDSGCHIETQGSGAFSKESGVGGKEMGQPAVCSSQVSNMSSGRYGGATRAAYNTHEGNGAQRKTLMEVKSRGHNLVLQLVSLSALEEVTGGAAKATAFSVYNKVHEYQRQSADASTAVSVGIDNEGDRMLNSSGDPSGQVRPSNPLLVLSQPCSSCVPQPSPGAEAEARPFAGMESPPSVAASPAGVLASEAPLICDPGGSETAEKKAQELSLHCCYALINSRSGKRKSKWLVSSWTDARGELLHTDVVKVYWYRRSPQGFGLQGLERALLRILQSSTAVAKGALEMSGHRVSLRNLYVTRLGFPLEREASVWRSMWKQCSSGCSQQWVFRKVVVSVLLSDPLLRLDVAGHTCEGTHVIRPAAQRGWNSTVLPIPTSSNLDDGIQCQQQLKGCLSDQLAVSAATDGKRSDGNGKRDEKDLTSGCGLGTVQAPVPNRGGATVVRFPHRRPDGALLPGELDTVRAWHVSVLCVFNQAHSDGLHGPRAERRESCSFMNSVEQQEFDATPGNQDPSHKGSCATHPSGVQEYRDAAQGSPLDGSVLTDAKQIGPRPAGPAVASPSGQVQRHSGWGQSSAQSRSQVLDPFVDDVSLFPPDLEPSRECAGLDAATSSLVHTPTVHSHQWPMQATSAGPPATGVPAAPHLQPLPAPSPNLLQCPPPPVVSPPDERSGAKMGCWDAGCGGEGPSQVPLYHQGHAHASCAASRPVDDGNWEHSGRTPGSGSEELCRAQQEAGMESTTGRAAETSPGDSAANVYIRRPSASHDALGVAKVAAQQSEEEKDCACGVLVAELNALSVLTSVHFSLSLFRPASGLGIGLGSGGWAGLHAHLPIHCCIVARLWALMSAAEHLHTDQVV